MKLLEIGLVSQSPALVTSVLGPELRHAYLKHPFALLPKGSELKVDGSRLTITGKTASVPATTIGPVAGSWTLLLVKEGTTWLVYGTQRA